MDTFILIMLAIVIVLLIAAIILIIANRPKADNGITLLDQKTDMNAKRMERGLQAVFEQMHGLTEKNYEQMLKINESLNNNAEKQTLKISEAIFMMQNSNEKKLEEMRKTVDEKLTDTLNQRLNSSFKTVSEQLQNVYKSLGEMKELSSGVTNKVADLNRVLTNVKARGTWAEVQKR